MTAQQSERTRTVERTLEIKTPIDAVWKALTDAKELERWFPLAARVKPGVGGGIWMSWGPPWEGENEVLVWEPPRHLRTGWPYSGDGRPDKASRVAVDYFLESRGGATVLRLVHSGFGADASWDAEYDSVRSGWAYELESLRHYLEHHAGADRRHTLAKATVSMPQDALWSAIERELGLKSESGPLRKGGRYSARALGSLPALSGVLLDADAPRQVAGTAEQFDNGLFRVMVYRSPTEEDPSRSTAWLWLATYRDDPRLADAQREWSALLGRIANG